MKTVVATDIHGISPELVNLLAPLGNGTIFLSPWETDLCPFSSEEEAVSNFSDHGGFEKYTSKISEAIGNSPALLIGFSVGATCSWLFAASHFCHSQNHMILYYGSRIRNHLELKPLCKTRLIFSELERSFTPSDLVAQLTSNDINATIMFGTSHGFMNPLSKNYSHIHAAGEISILSETQKSMHQPSV